LLKENSHELHADHPVTNEIREAADTATEADMV